MSQLSHILLFNSFTKDTNLMITTTRHSQQDLLNLFRGSYKIMLYLEYNFAHDNKNSNNKLQCPHAFSDGGFKNMSICILPSSWWLNQDSENNRKYSKSEFAHFFIAVTLKSWLGWQSTKKRMKILVRLEITLLPLFTP